MDEVVSFGRWLKARRKALDLTQGTLAQRVGCALSTIKKIEEGVLRPSRQIAELLAQQLAIPLEERATFVQFARLGLDATPLELPLPVEAQLPSASMHQPPVPPHNLPVPPTPLIGREREVAAVCDTLCRTNVRLLTLTGPGGVGKTRLALASAATLTEAFRDGVYFVNLAPICDLALVANTIAQTLGIKESSNTSIGDSLRLFFRDKQLLLLLDNFEQLLDAAPLLAEFLAACPHLKLLVTSRATLHLSGEHEYPVPPLDLPPQVSIPAAMPGIEAEDLVRYPAVQLFVARAQATQLGFSTTADAVASVAEICQRLDALPLAIELAAARVKLFTPRELLTRLDRRLPLLTGGAHDLPARQQTIRATIAWSYDLLTPAEQTLLRRLGVFAGGWALDAAEAVCTGEAIAQHEVLELLTQLVNKSLVSVERHDNHSRYRMLETIREYACEKLTESGETQRLQARHSAFFLQWAEELEPKLRGAQQVTWFDRLELEHDNLRAALAWSLTDASETGLRLAGALAWFWRVHNHFSEGRRWLEMARAISGAPPALRVKALVGAGLLAYAQGDDTQATVLLEESLALSRSQNNQWGIGWSLHGLGRVADGQGAYERATMLFEESLAPLRAVGDASFAYSLDWLGVVARHRGEYARAAEFSAEGLSIARAADDTWLIAWALIHSGEIAFAQGDYVQATALLAEGLVACRELRSTWGIMGALVALAQVAMEQGKPVRAVLLFGAAAPLQDILGVTPYVQHDPQLSAARAQLGAGVYDAAWAQGRAMPLNQAIVYALDPATIPEPNPNTSPTNGRAVQQPH